jgi:Uncharacterized conserved protein (DUF2190)
MAVLVSSTRNGAVEKFAPGKRITFTVEAGQSTLGGRLVHLTGNRQVRPATAASLAVAGVGLYDRAAGEKVTVARRGVWMLRASGAIAAGNQVIAAAAGDVSALPAAGTATAADINNKRAVVGRALEAITSTNTGPVALTGV